MAQGHNKISTNKTYFQKLSKLYIKKMLLHIILTNSSTEIKFVFILIFISLKFML